MVSNHHSTQKPRWLAHDLIRLTNPPLTDSVSELQPLNPEYNTHKFLIQKATVTPVSQSWVKMHQLKKLAQNCTGLLQALAHIMFLPSTLLVITPLHLFLCLLLIQLQIYSFFGIRIAQPIVIQLVLHQCSRQETKAQLPKALHALGMLKNIPLSTLSQVRKEKYPFRIDFYYFQE